MSRQLPHFDHHLREMRRTRQRFSVAVLALFVAVTVAAGVQLGYGHAASSTTADLNGVKIDISGAGTYGGSTTGPYANAVVTARRVSDGTSRADARNAFYLYSLPTVATGEHYVVSVSPVTVGGYTVKGLTWCTQPCTGFNPQTTNFRSGSSTDFTFHPGYTYSMRWIYQPVPTPTPSTPTPPPPTKTPGSTPKPGTPTPKVTPRPGGGSSTPVLPPPGTPDTTPPTNPTALEALTAGDNAIVALSWAASTDASSLKGYQLDRSLDQTTWSQLADGIATTTYSDDGAAFGVHYYYRLRAIDAAGNASGYATADATTPTFTPTSSAGSSSTYTSSDQIASVDLPSGAVATDAQCSIESGTTTTSSTAHPMIAGPYQLVCKSATGDVISDLQKPASWSYNLSARLKGYTSPQAISITSDGQTAVIKSAKLNSKSKVLAFSTTGSDATAVLASIQHGPPWSLIAIILLLLVIGGGVFVFILRRSQKQGYNDYLRSKYYNI